MKYTHPFASVSDELTDIILRSRTKYISDIDIHCFSKFLKELKPWYVILGYLDENVEISDLGSKYGNGILNIKPTITTDPEEKKRISEEINHNFALNKKHYSNTLSINTHHLDLGIFVPLEDRKLAILYQWWGEPSLSNILDGNEVDLYNQILIKLLEGNKELTSSDICRTKTVLKRWTRMNIGKVDEYTRIQQEILLNRSVA